MGPESSSPSSQQSVNLPCLQSKPSHSVSLRSILILWSYLSLCDPSGPSLRLHHQKLCMRSFCHQTRYIFSPSPPTLMFNLMFGEHCSSSGTTFHPSDLFLQSSNVSFHVSSQWFSLNMEDQIVRQYKAIGNTVWYATAKECYSEQFLSIKSGCYNERCYSERMLKRRVFINKIRMRQTTNATAKECYNEQFYQ
jgi:hypothetical protein